MRRTSRNLACFNNTRTQRKISYPQRIFTLLFFLFMLKVMVLNTVYFQRMTCITGSNCVVKDGTAMCLGKMSKWRILHELSFDINFYETSLGKFSFQNEFIKVSTCT